ncbi:MAG: cellobiose phosphorylase [Planctomycetota bacterium]|nr:MAG: cellobiose phosphorylase [Planctomycetota bacterium]
MERAPRAQRARARLSRGTGHGLLGNLAATRRYIEALRPYILSVEHEGEVRKIAEWFLDNDYLVLRAIRQIGADMPPGFYSRLVGLESGEPRVHAIAREFLSRTELGLDERSAIQFLVGYQELRPLRIGELWALPTMLRIEALTTLVAGLAARFPAIDPPAGALPGVPLAALLDDEERVGRAIHLLGAVDVVQWKRVFLATSLVERTLCEDPAGAHRQLAFETRDRVLAAVEELAWGTGRSELEVARAAVRMARESPLGHVGEMLIGDERRAFERVLGFRPTWRRRCRRFLTDHATGLYLGGIGLATLGLWAVPLVALAVSRAGTLATILGAALTVLPASTLAVTFIQWLVTHVLPPRTLPRLDFTAGIPPGHETLVVVPTLLGSADDVQALVRQLERHYLANPDPALHFAILGDWLDAQSETEPDDEHILASARAGIRLLNAKYGAGAGHRPFHLLHRRRLWNESEGCWMGWERKRGKLEELARLLAGRDDTTWIADEGERAALADVRWVITLDTDTQLPRGAAARLVGTMAHPMNRARFDPETGRVVSGYTVVQPRVEVSPTSGPRSLFTRLFSGDASFDIYTRAVSDVYQDLFGTGAYIGKGIYDVESFDRSLAGRAPENALLSHDLFEGLHGRVGLATDTILFEEYPPHYLAYARRLHRWVRGDWQLLPWLRARVPAVGGGKVDSYFTAIDRWKIFDNMRRSLLGPNLLLLLVASWTFLPGSPLAWTMLTLIVPGAHMFTELVTDLARRRRHTSDHRARWFARNMGPNLGRWLLYWVFLPHEALVSADAILRTVARVLWTRRRLLQWRTAEHTARLLSGRGPHALVWTEMAASPVFAVLLAVLLWATDPGVLLVAVPLLGLWFAAPEIAHFVSRPPRRRRDDMTAAERLELRAIARRTWLFFETFVGPEEQWLPPDNFQQDPGAVVAHRTSPTNIGMMFLSTLAAYDLGYLSLPQLVFRLRASFESLERLERYRGHLLNWYDTHTLSPLEPRYVSTVDSGNLAVSLVALEQACAAIASAPVLRRAQGEGVQDTLRVLGGILAKIAACEARGAPWRSLRDEVARIERGLELEPDEPEAWVATLATACDVDCPALDRALLDAIETTGGPADILALRGLRRWFDRMHQHLRDLRRETELLLPWLAVLREAPAVLAESPVLAEPWRALRAMLTPVPALDGIPGLCARAREPMDELLAHAADQSDEARRELSEWTSALETALASAESNARSLHSELLGIGAQAKEDALGMDFALLYDKDRHLFRIGYDVSADRFDPNHYDLLASEARLTSLFAIAKGDVPLEHWFHLGRPAARTGGSVALLSWGATMFEYLMPTLLQESVPGTFLGQSCRAALDTQIAYGRERGVPWGISESGYYLFDSDRNYQYRAFGVPGLGFKRGLADDLVITPYATVLAVSMRPADVARNLARLADLGMVGPYGLYESIDFTTARLDGRRFAIVRSYMSHHQGMILAAIDNYLNADVMVRRFHGDALIRTAELLLYEQVPTALPAEAPHRDPASVPGDAVARPELLPWTPHMAGPFPEAHALGGSKLGEVFTDSGGGWLHWRGIAMTRASNDPTCDDVGYWIYVRDEDTGALWSAGRRPTGAVPDELQLRYHPHFVELHRRDHGISMRMELAIAPEDDVELRTLELMNETDVPRKLTITTYAEVSLAPLDAADRHPAFDKLFVKSAVHAASGALLFHRRPRSPDDPTAVLLHRLVATGPGVRRIGFETDRERFLGRGGSARRPRALATVGEGLTGTTGFVLDPILAIQVEVVLPPRSRTSLAFLTLAAKSRYEALARSARFETSDAITRGFRRAAAEASRAVDELHLDPRLLPHAGRLLSAVLFPNSALRAAPATIAANRLGQPRLYGHGISGDVPIVVLRLSDFDDTQLLDEVLVAQALWRRRGLVVDLVVLHGGRVRYEDDVQGRLARVIAARGVERWMNRKGGIFLVRGPSVPAEELTFLESVAAAILDARHGTLADHMRRLQRPVHELPRFAPAPALAEPEETEPLPPKGTLLFDNDIGGFSADGKEYVIRLAPGERTPAPWCNVLANPGFGCLVSEAGIGYTWAENSGENRLTPWRNDPVTDEPAEVLYLRDEETGRYWSTTPAPAPGPGAYEVRHGAGYTRWLHHSHGLAQATTVFIDPVEPVQIVRLRVRNMWGRSRRVTATIFVEWVLGVTPARTRGRIVPESVAADAALLARCDWNPEFEGRTAFLATDRPVHGFTADRREFLGRDGSLAEPAALSRWGLSGRTDAGRDACGALQVHLDLGPHAECEVHFFLGQARSRAAALELVRAMARDGRPERAWRELAEGWEDVFRAVQVTTPVASMDLLLNRWLPYQNLSARLFGRTGLYQSSGAFGFRDQLQDVMALLFSRPDLARAHIIEAARHQFEAGDVLHWWHPPSGRGVRTRCSDDMLWLPFVAAHYVRATGDVSLLMEEVPFLVGEPLAAKERDRYATYPSTAESWPLMEHCRRALERAKTAGPHGLPLIGDGDWNDGMNRVGQAGKGESVWLAWFMIATCNAFAGACERTEHAAEAEGWRKHARELAATVEREAWDGSWYRRAWDDAGNVLGSRSSPEGSLDSIAQSWAALSGAGDPERTARALLSAKRLLVRRPGRVVRLLWPPYDKGSRDPGYIQAYPPGVRENGGQYTHAAAWLAWAFAAIGSGSEAERLFRLMNPVLHAEDEASARTYRVEPYVVAADVYGVPPHVGRGGWTWYTGAAAWTWRLGVEAILGLRLEDGELVIDPCVPASWRRYEAVIRRAECTCHIVVENPDGVERGVAEIELDGQPAPNGRVPLASLVGEHEVRVRLGKVERTQPGFFQRSGAAPEG